MAKGILSRTISWVACALVGAIFGVAGTISHSWSPGGFPIGITVAIITITAMLIAIRVLTRDRGAALACGIGMIAMVLIVSGEGPGGSVVVQDSIAGNVWSYVVPAVVLLVVAWPSFTNVTPVARLEAPAAATPRLIESVPRAEGQQDT